MKKTTGSDYYDNMREDVKFADPITITLPAAAWLTLITWYGESQVSGCTEMNIISHQFAEAVLKPSFFKEQEARHEQNRNRNPIEMGLAQIGIPACGTCGRIPNPISAPCPDCNDYQRDGRDYS